MSRKDCARGEEAEELEPWHSLLLQPPGSVGACRGLAEVRLQSASCPAAGGAEDEPRSQQHLLFGWPGESLMESTR